MTIQEFKVRTPKAIKVCNIIAMGRDYMAVKVKVMNCIVPLRIYYN